MAVELTPLSWDWPAVTRGDTYPEMRIQESSSTTTCTRVRVKIKASGATAASLDLDSDASGITIADTSAGAWDFTIDSLTSEQTTTLAAGFYAYDIEVTDSNGNVRTEFCGTWEILRQFTD